MNARAILLATLLTAGVLPAAVPQAPASPPAWGPFAEAMRRLHASEVDLVAARVDRRSPGEPCAPLDLAAVSFPDASSRCAYCSASVEEILAAVPETVLDGYPSVVLVAKGPRFAGAIPRHRKEDLASVLAETLRDVRFLAATAPREGGAPSAPEQRLARARICARLRWWNAAAEEARAAYTDPQTTSDVRVEAMLGAYDAMVALGRTPDAADLLARAERACEKADLDPCRPPFVDLLERLVLTQEPSNLQAVERHLAKLKAGDAVEPGEARALYVLARGLMVQGRERVDETLRLLERLLALPEEQGKPWANYAGHLRRRLAQEAPRSR